MSSVVVAVDRLSITECVDCSNHTTCLLARSIDLTDIMGAVLGSILVLRLVVSAVFHVVWCQLSALSSSLVGYTKQTGRRCRWQHPSMVIRRAWITHSCTRTFQYSTSALGSRQCHQGSAARIEGMRATSDEDKADNWHHITCNTAATTSSNGKIEPRTAPMTSIERASKRVV